MWLTLLMKYWKPLVIGLSVIALSWFLYHKGYQAAEAKYELQRAKDIEAELNTRKSIEAQLQTARARNYENEAKLDEAIKADSNLSCVVPDSVRTYINSIKP